MKILGWIILAILACMILLLVAALIHAFLLPKKKSEWKPTEDLIKYLELLFKPEEYVAYVTTDVYLTEDGRWVPSKGY